MDSKCKLFGAIAGICLLYTAPAHAITINIDSSDPFASQSAFEAGLSNTTKEDFEGFSALTFGDPISTSVGDFSGTGADGTGVCLNGCDELVVLDSDTTPFSGRFNTTSGGNNWLDSNDISEVTWDISTGGGLFNALGFMLMDPSDVGATLTIELVDGSSVSETITFSQSNGTLFYVSAVLDGLASSAMLTLTNSNDFTNDGFGIDDAVVGTVPEPGMLTLLGLGLAALGFSRRKKML